MEDKYALAIKAGALGSVLLIIVSFFMYAVLMVIGVAYSEELNQYLDESGLDSEARIPESLYAPLLAVVLAEFLLFGLMLAIFAGIGAIAARSALALITSNNDAAVLGAISVVVAEIIHRVVVAVIAVFLSFLNVLDASGTVEDLLFSFGGQVACYLPVMLLLGIFFAAIGSIAYVTLKRNLSKDRASAELTGLA